jgi:hypothetical protein
LKTNMIFSMAAEKVNAENPDSVSIYESHQVSADYLKDFDLVLVSYAQWKDFSRQKTTWINHTPSVLILKSHGNA